MDSLPFVICKIPLKLMPCLCHHYLPSSSIFAYKLNLLKFKKALQRRTIKSIPWKIKIKQRNARA